VAGVLFFHGGFTWMVGGYLGVSTFFTLSGFLITSLLLAERAAHGRVDLRTFWSRRFRRLMPASLACLALIVIFGVFAADPLQRASLAGDVIAALGYVANWRFIFGGQSYADLFAEPSPVLHFWSLAIEEQFYVIYPLLVGALVGFGVLAPKMRTAKRQHLARQAGRHYRLVVAGALVVLLLVSLGLTLFAGFDKNRIYLGTDTRAAELLIGGLLASVLFRGALARRMAQPGGLQASVAAVGALATVVSIALWVSAAQGTDWLYRGGFALYALLSALTIAAAILPTGPVAWVLSLGFLRHIGQISYGLYLYHWPIFLWIRQSTDLEIWPRFLLGVIITFVVAELSFHYLETPIRRGQRLFRVPPLRLAPVGIVALVGAVIAASATAPPPAIDFERAETGLSEFAEEPPPPTPIDPASLTPPARPGVAMFGDSTALMTGWGLAGYLKIHSDLGRNVEGVTGLGCGVLRIQERRIAGDIGQTNETCTRWAETWLDKVETGRPDVSVVQSGSWDVADVRVPGSNEWSGPGDPVFDEFLLTEMDEVVDVLTAEGGMVVWLTSPLPGPPYQAPPGWNASERLARYNQLVQQLPDRKPGKVVVVEFDQWVDTLPSDEDARLRPDGVHFTEDTSLEVSERFLVDAVLSSWRRQWVENRTAELEAGGEISVGVFGDATADALQRAFGELGDAQNLAVGGAPLEQCGVTRGGVRRTLDGTEALPEECDRLDEFVFMSLVDRDTDVALVHTALWDVTDRQLGDDPTWRAPGDPIYDEFLRSEIESFTDNLRDNGARNVVWLLAPGLDWGREEADHPANDRRRLDRLNEMIIEMAATRDFVVVIDYAAYAREWPDGDLDPARRPDGVTPNTETAREIAQWLAPQLVQVARGETPTGAFGREG
jgi:peptidoglycan/LPS O-acetylase OafA/YrhL/lysophospholipase L1-like esterase